jgi:hypothetical protein
LAIGLRTDFYTGFTNLKANLHRILTIPGSYIIETMNALQFKSKQTTADATGIIPEGHAAHARKDLVRGTSAGCGTTPLWIESREVSPFPLPPRSQIIPPGGQNQQLNRKEKPMKTNLKSVLIAVSLIAVACGVTAQTSDTTAPAPGGGGPRHQPHGQGVRMHLPPILAAVDADQNGILIADELAHVPDALTKLDANQDGQLTHDEIGPRHVTPPAEKSTGNATVKSQQPPFIAALDANGDGIIDAAEISNSTARLTALDKNNDGQLTLDELRPDRPGQPGRPEGKPSRGPRHQMSAPQQDRPLTTPAE